MVFALICLILNLGMVVPLFRYWKSNPDLVENNERMCYVEPDSTYPVLNNPSNVAFNGTAQQLLLFRMFFLVWLILMLSFMLLGFLGASLLGKSKCSRFPISLAIVTTLIFATWVVLITLVVVYARQ